MKKFFKKALSTLVLFGSPFGVSKSQATEVLPNELENAVKQTVLETQSATNNLRRNANEESEKKNKIKNRKYKQKNLKKIKLKKENKIDNNNNKIINTGKRNKTRKKEYILRGKNLPATIKDTSNSPLDEKINITKSNKYNAKDQSRNNIETGDKLETENTKETNSGTETGNYIPSEKELEYEKNDTREVKNILLNTIFLKAKTTMLSGKKIEHLNGTKTLEFRLFCPSESGSNKSKNMFFELSLDTSKSALYNEMCRLIFRKQMIPSFNSQNLAKNDWFYLNLTSEQLEDQEIFDYIDQRLNELPDEPGDNENYLREQYLKELELLIKESDSKENLNAEIDKENEYVDDLLSEKSENPNKNEKSLLTRLGAKIKQGYNTIKSKISSSFKRNK